MDFVHLQNILVQNNSLNLKNIVNPLFSMQLVQSAFVNNVTVKDSVGPIALFQGVLYKQLTNCLFENVTNSMELPESLQYQIKIETTIEEIYLNQTKPQGTEIKNITLNVKKFNIFFIRG